MPLLRKTSVRSPWLPSPLLSANTDPLRQTIVMGAIAPLVVMGAIALPIGRAGRPENTNWPARPALVQTVPVPVPGASVWLPTPARLPNSDPLRPTAIGAGQQPVPGASAWAPTPAREPNADPRRPLMALQGQTPLPGAPLWQPAPARLPNTDPLRPPVVQADPPDPTLVQSGAAWIGRLSRPEDVAWPARPARIIVGLTPCPAALVVPSLAPRDQAVVPPATDRLAPMLAVVGAQSWPGASVWQPSAPRAPNSDPLRPLALVQDAPDATLAQPSTAWLGRLPRDQVVAPPDRLALTAIVRGRQPLPPAPLWLPRLLRPPSTERAWSPWVLIGPQARNLALTIPLAGGRQAGEPAAPIIGACATLTPRAHGTAALDMRAHPIAAVVPAPRAAALTHQAKPAAGLARQTKPIAAVAPALRVAALARQTKPAAVLARQTKPRATLTQRPC